MMHGTPKGRRDVRNFSHHVQQLRIFAFLWANTLALGSCLCVNKSKTRQQQAVVLSSIPPRKPCVLCVLSVSASLFRNFSHHASPASLRPFFRTFEACYRTQSDWKSLLHTLPARERDARDAEGYSESDL